MRRRPVTGVVALGASLALTLAACGGTDTSSQSGNGTGTTPAYNAGVDKIFNQSSATGGTLRMAHSGDWDSLDGADTYYAYSWDFFRLYGRTLTTFAAAPGEPKLVPDLAQSLGVPSDNSKTWTYKLRTGVKFEDGTPVTSKDVKYAVERTLDKDTFPNGPTYFNDFLDLQGYTSPYKDSDPQKLGLKAIETPDDQTIVFHLKQPFSGFDYLGQIPSTAPVPRAKDTGTKYKEHVVSTGPYTIRYRDTAMGLLEITDREWALLRPAETATGTVGAIRMRPGLW